MPQKVIKSSKLPVSKDVFVTLEKKMVKYKDLATVKVKENSEKFIFLDASVIPNGYLKEMIDMEKLFGPRVLVRKSVSEKLVLAQNILQAKYPNLTLHITYGYRSLKVQTERFQKILGEIDSNSFPNQADLYEEAHRYVAVPTVAGHPTGGAVDVIVKNVKTEKSLDFGSKQYNYATKDCYVFTPNTSKIQRKNRILLRDTLVKAGFAPFDGEWWHFSYGDREWAFYYKEKSAKFSQLNPEEVILENE